MRRIAFSILFTCFILTAGVSHCSVAAAASPSIHLSMQGSESDAVVTYGAEINVTGWKDTDDGILSLLRYPTTCHEGYGTETNCSNCTASIGEGKEDFYDAIAVVSNLGQVLTTDVTGDGINEVIAISSEWAEETNCGIKVFEMPSKTPLWSKICTAPSKQFVKKEDVLTGIVAVGDINNDEYLEVILATGYGYAIEDKTCVVYAFDGNTGEELWNTAGVDIGELDSPYIRNRGDIIVGDVHNDSNNEVIVGTKSGLYILNGTDGSLIWNYTAFENISWVEPVDVDNDGVNEVVAVSKTTGVFAVDVTTETELWNNTYNPSSDEYFLYPRVGHIDTDEYPDLVLSNYKYLIAYHLKNGTILLVSEAYPWGTSPAFSAHSKQPPDMIDINGDGYNDVFGTHDVTTFHIYDGRDGSSLKNHFVKRAHFLYSDEAGKNIILGLNEFSLRLWLLNSTGDTIWNEDIGAGLYEEFPQGGRLGNVRPFIIDNYIFAITGSESISLEEDSYLLIVNLSDGYIYRKHKWSASLHYILKDAFLADINGDGIDEVIMPTMGSNVVRIINKSILYDSEIYEPNETLESGVYTYTLNLHDDEGNVLESVARTLTVLDGGENTTPPTLISCDSFGTEQELFETTERIYAKGCDLTANTTVDLYVVDNATWNDGDLIASYYNKTSTTIDAEGCFPPIMLWANPEKGYYDIIADANRDGSYTSGIDAIDDVSSLPGIEVIIVATEIEVHSLAFQSLATEPTNYYYYSVANGTKSTTDNVSASDITPFATIAWDNSSTGNISIALTGSLTLPHTACLYFDDDTIPNSNTNEDPNQIHVTGNASNLAEISYNGEYSTAVIAGKPEHIYVFANTGDAPNGMFNITVTLTALS